jgi:RNA polymerase sigma factor (TIGR02999 family)
LDSEVEALLRRAEQADPSAADELFSLLYADLHRIAENALRRGGGGSLTLGTTTLVHEAYLNVVGRDALAFGDRVRFLAYLSRAMRGLVIDFARRRSARKRGRELEITLVEDAPGAPPDDAMRAGDELVRLGDALGELAELEPALAELVDLHFFCGFSFAEIASLRGVSERTVQRDWRKARLLLHHTLADDQT